MNMKARDIAKEAEATQWLMPGAEMWTRLLVPSSESEWPLSRSPIEQLLDAFEMHVASEAESVEEYRRLAENSSDQTVALLMGVVLEDEKRHHKLLERMAASIRNSLRWSSRDEALLSGPVHDAAPVEETVAAMRGFIREEHDGARRMRELARMGKNIGDGLFTLLLETIAIDSEKHERILRFVLKRLMSRGASA